MIIILDNIRMDNEKQEQNHEICMKKTYQQKKQEMSK